VIIPPLLDLDDPDYFLSPPYLPACEGLEDAGGLKGPESAFGSFQDAAKVAATLRPERQVTFRSLEEHKRELGFEQFMLETDDAFCL
jgi:hypothetical protein